MILSGSQSRSVLFRAWVAAALIGLAAATPAAEPELLSKRYQFKDGVILKMGASATSGLRLDTVTFKMPAHKGERLRRTSGLLTADVSVSNTADRAHKVGVAIALFDGDGRLLAVASGGSKLSAIKPKRQKTFGLVFEDVNGEAHKATTFHITLETKP